MASDASVGDVSTIVVTAISDLDGTQNSVLAQLVVISNDNDTVAPRYEISEYTSCSPASSAENTCANERWSFKAQVFDEETGMSGWSHSLVLFISRLAFLSQACVRFLLILLEMMVS